MRTRTTTLDGACHTSCEAPSGTVCRSCSTRFRNGVTVGTGWMSICFARFTAHAQGPPLFGARLITPRNNTVLYTARVGRNRRLNTHTHT